MAGQPVHRVVVIELWNIGDVILTMPFLAQLRSVFPEASIALAAKSFASDLLSGTGLVDEFIVVDLAWSPSDDTGPGRKFLSLFQASRTMRARKFDIAFSGRDHFRERVLLGLSGARRRVARSGSRGDQFLTDAVESAPGATHRVDSWLALLNPFGGAVDVQVPRLHITDAEREWADDYLASRGAGSGDVIIGIHPGASLPEKRWPMDRFREVAAAAAPQPGLRVITFADPSGFGDDLFDTPGVIGAQVSFRELIALINRCDLLVCNDSGPMHIAGAVGVPTVALFGEGIAESFSPLGLNHEILRAPPSPEAKHSVTAIRSPAGIRTQEVLDAIDRAVGRLKGSAVAND